MKLKMLLLSVCGFIFLNCQSQNSAIKNISPKMFSEQIKITPSKQLLDVRTPEEFAVSHLSNSTNIDWNGENFDSQTATLNKNEPIYIYCKSGVRSAKAANRLHELGFTAIYNLEGGITQWQTDGFEVTK